MGLRARDRFSCRAHFIEPDYHAKSIATLVSAAMNRAPRALHALYGIRYLIPY